MISATADYSYYGRVTAPSSNPSAYKASGSKASCCGSDWGRIAKKIVSTLSAAAPLVGFSPVGIYEHDAAPIQVIQTSARSQYFDEMNALRNELISYQDLDVNWDGFGGLPVNSKAMLDALELLTHVPRDIPPPKPMLSGNGSVGLYWDYGSYYASLEFEGDGTYTYLTDSPAGYGGAEGVVTVFFPLELKNYLVSAFHLAG